MTEPKKLRATVTFTLAYEPDLESDYEVAESLEEAAALDLENMIENGEVDWVLEDGEMTASVEVVQED